MGGTSEALFGVQTRIEEELGGQLHGDHGQLLGIGGQFLIADIWSIGVDDFSHELKVLVRVLVAVVQETHILLLNALLDRRGDLDLFEVITAP